MAGLDERERGFNRSVELTPRDNGYHAVFRYESTVVEVDGGPAVGDALGTLVGRLQAMGYRQVRSRASFRGDAYLGSQEMWVEYPDPEGPRSAEPASREQLARRTGWIGRVLNLFASKEPQ